MKLNRFVAFSFSVLALVYCLGSDAFGYYMKAPIPLGDGKTLPGYIFLPYYKVRQPLPAVVVGVGVGATKIYQYHEHCQLLANRGFAVLLMDPSNYPEDLAPGPWNWDHGAGYVLGSFNQGFVGAKLAVGNKWYLKSFEASINYMCSWPLVDPTKIALSGFSQAANAVLAVGSSDPRVKAIVWNYGGWPWIMPYTAYKLPPVEIFHGEKDDVYKVKYARELAWNLKTNMRPYELNIYPDQGHMFNIVYDLRTENRYMKPALLDAFERMVAFLERTLCVQDSSGRRGLRARR